MPSKGGPTPAGYERYFPSIAQENVALVCEAYTGPKSSSLCDDAFWDIPCGSLEYYNVSVILFSICFVDIHVVIDASP